MMAHELSNGLSNWKSGSKERLQQMFPAEEEEDGAKSFTERYHKYKRQYVKHLSFNPKEENLSKCVFRFFMSLCAFDSGCYVEKPSTTWRACRIASLLASSLDTWLLSSHCTNFSLSFLVG